MSNIKRLKTESIAKSMATLINNANDATEKDNSIFTVYDILLAMLWRKANSKQDYQKYFNQLDGLFFENKKIIHENDWWDNSGEYKEYTKDEMEKIKKTEDPAKLSLEDFIIYQKFSVLTKFPPLVKGASVTYKANDKKYNFPDCGETSLRNFFNILLYDPETQSFDIEILRNLGLENDSDLVKFYKKYPGVSNIESHNEKDPNNNAYDDWAAIVSEIPDVIYRDPGICEISGEGGIKNMYVILGNLLEIEDFDFDKLAEKLKSINIELDYNAKTDIETNNNDNAIDFELGGWLNPLNFSWRFRTSHFVITFQEDKTKSDKLSNYINTLTNANKEEAENLEPSEKRRRLFLDTSQLKQRYAIYGNYLTQIIKAWSGWDLGRISKDIKLIPLFLNTNLDIVMPGIVKYYSEIHTPMDVDEPGKEKNSQNQLENLITKYLSKINFLNETNFKTIDAIIKQKVDNKFANELKKIVNQATDPERLGWVAKSLILNNYKNIPEWANSLKQNITTLYLSNNQLTALPDWIGNLKNLQTLHLDQNQLETLPDCIGNLKNLKRLRLNNNQFTTLPDSFGNLKKLERLWLNNNQFETLPNLFGKLENLKMLNLYNNQLKTLPDDLGKLTNLQSLVLSSNKLTTLPESFGKLKNLNHLDLSGNQFTEKEKGEIKKLLPETRIKYY